MDTLGSCRQRDVRPAINQHPAWCCAGKRHQAAGQLEQLSIREILFAYLNKIHAVREAPANDSKKRAAGGLVSIGDKVEKRALTWKGTL